MLNQLVDKLLKQYSKKKPFTRKMLLFVEAIPTPVFWLDRNKLYQGCNQVFSDLMGLTSPLDIIGLNDKDLPYSSEDLKMRNDIFDSILNNQTPTKILYDCIVSLGDKVIWIQKRFTPLKNHKGKIVGVLGAIIDISEKVNRRQELDSFVEQRNALEGLLGELNAAPFLSTKHKELIEKSIINLQKESQASLAVFLKAKASSSREFMRFSTEALEEEVFFKKRNVLSKISGESGYLDKETLQEFHDIGKLPIKSIFYYRIHLNDFVTYDEVILLINPHKDKLEAISSYSALIHHLIHYFHVNRFITTAKQLSQHIKKSTTSSNS